MHFINDDGENVCTICGIVHGYQVATDYVDFHENVHRIKRKSVCDRKYHLENKINQMCHKYGFHMRDWVELSTCEDVFLLAPEILTLLRVFLVMEDLFNCPKRKTRTSNSDSETNSPEGKRICKEENFVDAFQGDAIADDNQEL